MNVAHLKFPATVLAVGLVIGLIGDLMLYNQPFGISYPILILMLTIGLLGLATLEKTTIIWANLWLIAPMLALAAFSAVRAEPLLRFMNIAGALGLGLLLANRLANRPHFEMNFGQYAAAWIESALTSLLIPVPLIARALAERPKGGEGQSRRSWRGVLVGLLIALPLLLVFSALFASADLVFNNLVKNILELIRIPDVIGHAFLTAFLGWLAMGGLAYGLTRLPSSGFMGVRVVANPDDSEGESGVAGETAKAEVKVTAQGVDIRSLLGTLEASVVLFSIDALFGVFVGIQFAALFGGEVFLRSQGLTYSEYARRGFFELLTVSLIVMGLILTLDFITRRETARRQGVFLAGVGLMVALTIVILASAYLRMQLYEEAYGFTLLRVYPHIFMIWLAILFAAFLVVLILRRVYLFASAVLVFCIGFVLTMNILNPDAFIVRQNVARGSQGEEVDAAYLGSLSEDAIPDLVPLLDDPKYREVIGPWLHNHLVRLDTRQAHAGWAAYHLSINRAYDILAKRRAEIEGFDLNKIRFSYD